MEEVPCRISTTVSDQPERFVLSFDTKLPLFVFVSKNIDFKYFTTAFNKRFMEVKECLDCNFKEF